MDVIVVGAGASGIIAALKASENNNVILLEKNDKCGKKILITGNGKCNYWNSNINASKYNTDSKVNLEKILEKKEETFKFLSNLGIYSIIKNDYYYPHSESSMSIKEIFTKALEKKVKVIYNTNVLEIQQDDNKFKVITNNQEYLADKVILSTGSKASSKTGSSGDGYKILEKLDFKLNCVLPALVGLKAKESYLKDWDGLRVNANLNLFIDNYFIKKSAGEIQLTNYGISGICVFNLSSLVSKALHEKKKVEIEINFFEQDFYEFMNDYSKKIKLNLEETLESLFNYKLMYLFFKLSKIDKNKCWKDLSVEEKRKFSNIINHFNLKIIDTNDFERAQVCTGGLPLSEINPLTMETKIRGFYVTGELLDVDGECGGFNLAFAFITGYIAGDQNA